MIRKVLHPNAGVPDYTTASEVARVDFAIPFATFSISRTHLGIFLEARCTKILLPTDPRLTSGYLWHNNLRDENIFIDPENPTHNLGVIDRQSMQLSPLFDNAVFGQRTALLGMSNTKIYEITKIRRRH